MPKKTIVLLAALSMGVGLPGAYLQALVSWECDNYCFAPSYPTPALLYLWFSLFLIGTGLGFLAWIDLFVKQFVHKNWVWGFVTAIAGGVSCFGFLGALLGTSEATFLLLGCAIYVLIALIIIPKTPPSQGRFLRGLDPNVS